MSDNIATIGVKFDSADLERGKAALEAMAASGPKVEAALLTVEAAGGRTGKTIGNLGGNSKIADLGKDGAAAAAGMDKLGQSSSRAGDAIRASTTSTRISATSYEAMRAAVEGISAAESKHIARLVDEHGQLSQNRSEMARYQAAQAGMSEGAQDIAGAIGGRAEALRREREEMGESTSAMDSLKAAAIGLAASLAGVALATFSLDKFIAETKGAQQEQAQLEAVLRSTGEAAGWSAERLNMMGEALASKSVFSGGDITQAQTRLLSYTGIVGEQFPRAMQNVIDMAQRMGMDVKSSAEVIGRALDIPSEGLSALQRQGFRFSEAQKELVEQLEATGRAGEAQGIILDALEASYGGAAFAARDTLGGSLSALENSINDLMTGGDGSVTGLRTAADFLTESVGNASTVINALSASSESAAADLGALATVQEGLAIAFETVAVLGSNVAYVLTSVGRELGGLAAQAAQFAQSGGGAFMLYDVITKGKSVELDAIKAIGEAMKADAVAARKEVDATTERIMNARKQAKELSDWSSRNASANTDPRRLDGASGAVDETKRMESAEKGLLEVRMRSLGVTKQYTDDLRKLQAARAAGAITEQGYIKEVEALATATYKSSAAGKDAAASAKGGASAASSAASAYASLVSSINQKIEAERLELSGGDKLSASQRERIKLDDDIAAGRSKLTAAQVASVRAALDTLDVAEKQNSAAKEAMKTAMAVAAARTKESDGIAAWMQAQEDAGAASLKSAADRITGLQGEEEAARMAAAMNISLASAIERIALARLREKQAGFRANSDGYNALQKEIEAREKILELVEQKGAREAQAASNQAMVQEWEATVKQYDDIFRQGFAGMVNGGENAWKSFTKSLTTTFKTTVADQIYKMFAQPFVVKMVASILGITGGGAAMAAQAATGGGGGDIISTASNAYSMLTKGVSGSIEAGFAKFATSSAGQSLGLSTAGVAGNNPSAFVAPQLTSAGSQMGAALGVVGNTLAGYALGSMANSLISGGYSVSSGMETFQKVGTAVGSAIGGPVMGAIVGAAAGVVNRLFGRKLKDSGIEGNFGGASGFEGNSYQYLKGGLFRSDKTKRGELDDGLQDYLSQSFKVLQTQTGAFAETLGLQSDKVASFTSAIKLSLMGLNEQEATAALEGAVKQAGNDLAQTVLGTDTFSKAGEAAGDTLARLAVSLSATNGWLDTLGLALKEASLASASASSNFIELFGSMDTFNTSMASYYENYYSEAERMGKATAELAKAFASAGVEMPASKEAYRKLLEEQLAAGEAGQELAAKLLLLNGAFAEVTDYAEQAAADTAQAAADAATALLESVGIGAADMGRTFRDVLIGRTDAQEAGEALAQQVQGGVYNALAGGFAEQLTQLMTTQLIQPVVQAALAGASVSEVVSQSAINSMVAQAHAASAALGAILNDASFRAAMDGIGAAVTGAIGAAGGGYKPVSFQPAPSYASNNYAPAVAAANDAWRDLLVGIVRQTKDATREMSRLGMTGYDAALAAINDKAQEQFRSLQDAGYKRNERQDIEVYRYWRDAYANGADYYRAAGYSEDSREVQGQLRGFESYSEMFSRLSAELNKLPPELQAAVDAEIALLNARSASTAAATLASLAVEVSQIGMSSLAKSFFDIESKAADYTKGLIDLGQATDLNIAGVKSWADAMLEQTRAGAYDQLLSPEEIKTRDAAKLGSDFAALGSVVPESTATLRGMIDAAREVGNLTLVDSLLELVPAFVALQTAAEGVVDSLANQTEANKIIALLGKEVAQLGMSGIEKELAGINDRADEYRASLIALGQGTDTNITAVQKWQNAMTEAALATQAAADIAAAAADAQQKFAARNAAGALKDRLQDAMGGKGTFAAQREGELWIALAQTGDYEKQLDLATQLTDLVLARQQLEVQNATRLLDFGRNLRGYVDGLKIGALSPLTMGEKVAEAQRQYQETLAKAQGGDTAAQSGLQGIASSYLDLARTYFAGNEQFAGIFGGVTTALDALGAASMTEAQQQLAIGTQSLGELQKLYAVTETAYAALDTQYEAAVLQLAAAQEALVLQTDNLEQLKAIATTMEALPAEIAVRLPTIDTAAADAKAEKAASELLEELRALRQEVAQLRTESRQDAQMQAGVTAASADASAERIAQASAQAARASEIRQGATLT